MKFEYGDFYKFITSLGIVLVGLSIMIPWLFLREPFDLFIKQDELFNLTPLAQSMIANRQALLNTLLRIIPWLSGAVFLLGSIALVAGGYLWANRTQKLIDELNKLNRELLKRQLEEIPPAEKEAMQINEVELELENSQVEDLLVKDTAVKELVKSALEVEKNIATLFSKCLSSMYDVLQNRRMGSVIFDMVLVSKDQTLYDLIVEVKYVRKGFKYGWVRDNTIKLVYSSLLYQQETNREARSMLFIIGPEKVIDRMNTQEYYRRIEKEITRLRARVFIILLREDELGRLTCDEDIRKIIEHVNQG